MYIYIYKNPMCIRVRALLRNNRFFVKIKNKTLRKESHRRILNEIVSKPYASRVP